LTNITYPNPRNCAELVMHVWNYYAAQAEYRCARCDLKISKALLKEATDNA